MQLECLTVRSVHPMLDADNTRGGYWEEGSLQGMDSSRSGSSTARFTEVQRAAAGGVAKVKWEAWRKFSDLMESESRTVLIVIWKNLQRV